MSARRYKIRRTRHREAGFMRHWFQSGQYMRGYPHVAKSLCGVPGTSWQILAGVR